MWLNLDRYIHGIRFNNHQGFLVDFKKRCVDDNGVFVAVHAWAEWIDGTDTCLISTGQIVSGIYISLTAQSILLWSFITDIWLTPRAGPSVGTLLTTSNGKTSGGLSCQNDRVFLFLNTQTRIHKFIFENSQMHVTIFVSFIKCECVNCLTRIYNMLLICKSPCSCLWIFETRLAVSRL